MNAAAQLHSKLVNRPGIDGLARPITVVLLLLVSLLLACSGEKTPEQVRGEGGLGDPIVVAVPWPFSTKKDRYRQGVELAVTEINKDGGILGRPLEMYYADDGGKAQTGKAVAQVFAEDPEVVAVLGHFDTHIAEPVSLTYEYRGLLLMTPGATHPNLTKQGFSRIFRTIPSDIQVGGQLAEIANQKNYKKLVIIHEQSNYGRQLANAIEFRCEEIGTKIVDRLSYDSGIQDYRTLLARLRLLEFDGLFFAGMGGDAGPLITAARKDGFSQPFLGGNGLDTPALFEANPEAVEGTLVLSVFDSENPSPYVQFFNKRFVAAYGAKPDAWAAQGYDLVQLFAHGIRRAQSAKPAAIARALKSVQQWHGITGSHSFDETGELSGKPMVVKVARSGKLAYQGI